MSKMEEILKPLLEDVVIVIFKRGNEKL